MFNSINLKKITATTFLAILMAGTLISQPAISGSSNSGSGNNNGHGNNCDGIDYSNPGKGSPDGKNRNHNETNPNVDDEGKGNCSTSDSIIKSKPLGISSLETTNKSATSSTIDIYKKSKVKSMNFGTGNNIKLTGFTVGTKDYSLLQLVDKAQFQRIDNNAVKGERHIFFLQSSSDHSKVESSFIDTMEKAVRSEFINIGTDNVFANKNEGTPNYNNIERVDFLINNGFSLNQNYVDNAGFLLLERGGNDPFKIAAITQIDANGNPSAFGNLLDISKNTWGDSGITMKTSVFQTESQWIEPHSTSDIPNQNIHGIFVSVASLGVTSGQTIYGYAVFPYDVNANSDLVGLSDFSKTTGSGSGEGGLDLMSSGGLFIPKGDPITKVFKNPPLTPQQPQVVVFAD